jgi:hypothetical protein
MCVTKPRAASSSLSGSGVTEMKLTVCIFFTFSLL